MKCKITPEHKVRSSSYNVKMVIDERKGEIVSCECLDCAASAGGCKHAVAFLMWTHRRSEEPSCTEVECYWKKPRLSRVGTTLKYITVEQMCKQAPQCEVNTSVFTEFIQEAKKRKISNCELLKYQPDFKHSNVRQFSFHHFLMQASDELKTDVDKALASLTESLTDNVLAEIETATKSQYKNPLWHELRYAWITASKVFDVSRCRTSDGSLVAAIMGAKTPDTQAMERGRRLEASVIKTVQNLLKKKVKPCGLFLSAQYPMIAATPDGICKDAVIEVKCPTNDRTKTNYLSNGNITKKYKAQIQLQMFVTKMKKGYFCVAHPDFENSKRVDIIVVDYDSHPARFSYLIFLTIILSSDTFI
ncbi:yqaJ-like viral recombinase domain-containing protein [Phthorimaea operculella]|nr:yqaJ-like viral recombinase domain-containing protein [Phthorimaea operculella]